MTTTIDVLPEDVLLYIFLVAKERQSAQHPPIVISQVCKRWRSLSLSNPLLWNKLHLENSGAEDGAAICLRIARTFSRHSFPLLLDVVIKDDFCTLPHGRILEPYVSRIRSLDMNRVRIQFNDLKRLLEEIGPRAADLWSMKLPRCENWNDEDDLLTDKAAPLSTKLDRLALSSAVCLECCPFPLSYITHLELKEFSITRSRLTFIFRNMPILSTLAIEVDQPCHPGKHHFHFHESTIDTESNLSPLIPSSSLQKLTLFFGEDDQSWFECICGLEFLDVQNVKYLELHSPWSSLSLSLRSDRSQAHHLRIFEAWKDRLASLETLVLSSVDLLDLTGGSRKLIGSARPGGIDLVIQTPPTFKTYQDILSSFTAIASLTIYLPRVTSYLSSDSPCEDVGARPSTVTFPITFIPTPHWQILPSGEVSSQSNPLLLTELTELTEDHLSSESIVFIRHMAEVAKGGQIPVRFVDSPSYPPGFLLGVHYDTDYWDGWGKGWMDRDTLGKLEITYDDEFDDDSDGWGETGSEASLDDVYGGGYGSGVEEEEEEEEEFEDYDGPSCGW